MGNIGSIAKKIKRIGYEPLIATKGEEILTASKLILPGVGHFASGVDNLKKLGMWKPLNEAVLINEIPILGICLGMQLMAKHSEEGDSHGLGWIDADVRRFVPTDKHQYKIPHTGWNTIDIKRPNALIKEVSPNDEFYFVHSYYFKCDQLENQLAATNYEIQFTSAIQKENIYGVQFHPEKSHESGEKILINFANLKH